MGMRFPASSLDEYQVEAYWKMERENMLKILDEYLLICRQIGVRLLMFLFAIFLQLIIIVVFPFFIKLRTLGKLQVDKMTLGHQLNFKSIHGTL